MPGIDIPSDRCNRNMPRGYCLNPECRESSTDSRFEFDVEQDKFHCPKCKSDSPLMVGLLVLIHYLVRDPKGPIVGSQGFRYRFACNPPRVVLATETNKEAASGDLAAVNCPGCLKAVHDQKLGQKQGWALMPPDGT
jgi:hypothetical protein